MRNPSYYSDQATVKLSTVEPEEIEWLWPGYIPRRAITILDGNPGLGKSLLALDIAARLTTGRPMPNGTRGAWGEYLQDVLLLCGEDDLSTTIRSRLIAAGANLERVHAMKASVDYDEVAEKEVGLRSLLLPRDVDEVESKIMSIGANLVIIDPLMMYLDPRVNSWRDQDIRVALAPMAAFAQLGHLSFPLIRHLNKGTSSNPQYRGAGSISIIAAARSGLLVAPAPEDPEHEHILAQTKSNLGPPVPALRYRIESLSDDPYSQAVRIQWLGPTTHTAVSLLNQPAVEPEPSAVEEAMAFLREVLREGGRPAEEVKQEAHVLDITPATLKRARERLGVQSRREGFGRSGRWLWKLPSDPAHVGDAGADGRAG